MHDQGDGDAPRERALLSLRRQGEDDSRHQLVEPLPAGVLDVRPPDPVALGWAEFIQRVPWHQFWTLTFRAGRGGRTGGMHGEAADKAFRFFVSSLNRELYGANWGKRWHRGVQWARGQEFHKDGRLHFHAVAAAPNGDLNRLMSRYRWHEFWYRNFGRNRLEVPRSQAEVAGYVAKYVSKDGEVDFSANYNAWTPPPPDYLAAPQQTHLVGCGSTNDHPRTDASIASGRAPRGDQSSGP